MELDRLILREGAAAGDEGGREAKGAPSKASLYQVKSF
jgi:hypothetical protein